MDSAVTALGFRLGEVAKLDRQPAPKPQGHRFFSDCYRETNARFIEWGAKTGGVAGWFATLTFKDYVSITRAERFKGRWLGKMTQALSDSGGGRLRWISASEWQKRDVIHYHLLVAGHGLGYLSRKRWESKWELLGGGFCQIHDASSKAAPYLAKYLNKDRGGEVQWGGAWQGLSAPLSVSCHQVGAPINGRTGVILEGSPPR